MSEKEESIDKMCKLLSKSNITKIPFNRMSIGFAINYVPKHFDKFLVSYPKCGNSWTQQIIHLIINGGELKDHINSDETPFFDNNLIEGLKPNVIQYIQSDDRNRAPDEGFVWKTHLSCELLPFSKNSKYLLVLRNPKDCLVSYYHFIMSKVIMKFDFQQFFQQFISGDVLFGDYFTFVKQYWIHTKNEQNFTILLYEKMIRDIKQSIETIAQFLGQKYVNRLSNDDKLMDKIIEKSNIKSMKEIYKNELFVRKGVVGDWRSHLTKDESDLIDKRVEEEWMGTGLELLWMEEMKWIEKKL